MKKYMIFASAFLMASSAKADVVEHHSEAAETAVVEETASVSPFNGAYLGLGIGFGTMKCDSGIAKLGKPNLNRCMGSLVLGYGRALSDSPLYLGAELMGDFGKSKKKTVDQALGASAVPNTRLTAKRNGFSGSFGVRVGYLVPDSGLLVYGKVGGSYNKANFELFNMATDAAAKVTSNVTFKTSSVKPMFALGVEKMLSNKFAVRGEVEYVLPTKCKYKNAAALGADTTAPTNPAAVEKDTEHTAKLKNGLNFRLMATYHVAM